MCYRVVLFAIPKLRDFMALVVDNETGLWYYIKDFWKDKEVRQQYILDVSYMIYKWDGLHEGEVLAKRNLSGLGDLAFRCWVNREGVGQVEIIDGNRIWADGWRPYKVKDGCVEVEV